MKPPEILHIETTTFCNLSCRHCSVRKADYVRRILGPEVWGHIVPAIRGPLLVILSGHGETLTHARFVEMFRDCAAAGAVVEFQSNCQLLSPDLSRTLVASGAWTRLKVSIDGIGATYEHIRDGASWIRLLEALAGFNGARGSRRPPYFSVECVVMRENLREVPEIARLSCGLKADRFMLTDLVEYESWPGQGLANDEEARPYLAEAWEICKAARVLVEASEATRRFMGWPVPERERRPCDVPWRAPFITASGAVQPCCRVPAVMGDLREQTLEEIWSGERFARFRHAMRTPEADPVCLSCRWRLGGAE